MRRLRRCRAIRHRLLALLVLVPVRAPRLDRHVLVSELAPQRDPFIVRVDSGLLEPRQLCRLLGLLLRLAPLAPAFRDLCFSRQLLYLARLHAPPFPGGGLGLLSRFGLGS
mgnify:FL=1